MTTVAIATKTYWVIVDKQCCVKGPSHPLHQCGRELRLQVHQDTLSKDEGGEARGRGRGRGRGGEGKGEGGAV